MSWFKKNVTPLLTKTNLQTLLAANGLKLTDLVVGATKAMETAKTEQTAAELEADRLRKLALKQDQLAAGFEDQVKKLAAALSAVK